jgi:hypothetical protein
MEGSQGGLRSKEKHNDANMWVARWLGVDSKGFEVGPRLAGVFCIFLSMKPSDDGYC